MEVYGLLCHVGLPLVNSVSSPLRRRKKLQAVPGGGCQQPSQHRFSDKRGAAERSNGGIKRFFKQFHHVTLGSFPRAVRFALRCLEVIGFA